MKRTGWSHMKAYGWPSWANTSRSGHQKTFCYASGSDSDALESTVKTLQAKLKANEATHHSMEKTI